MVQNDFRGSYKAMSVVQNDFRDSKLFPWFMQKDFRGSKRFPWFKRFPWSCKKISMVRTKRFPSAIFGDNFRDVIEGAD